LDPFWEIDQKYFESFQVLCWRRMDKITCTDHVENEDVWNWIKEERKMLHIKKTNKHNWIGNISRRNCLLRYVIEGKAERKRRKRHRTTGWPQVKENVLEYERGSTRSHVVENSLRVALWTSCKIG
jgi:uncharacterized protein (DUF2344 family)